MVAHTSSTRHIDRPSPGLCLSLLTSHVHSVQCQCPWQHQRTSRTSRTSRHAAVAATSRQPGPDGVSETGTALALLLLLLCRVSYSKLLELTISNVTSKNWTRFMSLGCCGRGNNAEDVVHTPHHQIAVLIIKADRVGVIKYSTVSCCNAECCVLL